MVKTRNAKDDSTVECAYCNKKFQKRGIAMHERQCYENPETSDLVCK